MKRWTSEWTSAFKYYINFIFYTIFSYDSSAGGLVTAVAPVVAQCGGIWIGWSGVYLEDYGIKNIEIPESDPSDKTPTAGIKSKQVNRIRGNEH